MKNTKLTRIISASLATVIVGTTFFAYFRIPAGAAVSLNTIENIKATKQNNNQAFNIVEIAPSSNSGTIGYYVDGQEPPLVSGWFKSISNMDDAADRIGYTNEVVMQSLKDRDLLSATADDAPLLDLGEYTEHYPWQSDFYTNHYDQTANMLTLSSKEKFTGVVGTPVQYESGSRDGYVYSMDYTYRLAAKQSLFDFSDWFDGRKSTFNEGDEYLQMDNGSGSFTYDEASEVLTLTNSDDNANYMKLVGGFAPENIYFA
jgi:hypothetical protein